LDSALWSLAHFNHRPSCVIIKHNSPCGLAEDDNLTGAFEKHSLPIRSPLSVVFSAFPNPLMQNAQVQFQLSSLKRLLHLTTPKMPSPYSEKRRTSESLR
jgi:hypothetical protein